MYPQGVCRIRKPACAGNGCAIFPIFQTADWGQKIRYPAADDLFRVSLGYFLPAFGREENFSVHFGVLWYNKKVYGSKFPCKR